MARDLGMVNVMIGSSNLKHYWYKGSESHFTKNIDPDEAQKSIVGYYKQRMAFQNRNLSNSNLSQYQKFKRETEPEEHVERTSDTEGDGSVEGIEPGQKSEELPGRKSFVERLRHSAVSGGSRGKSRALGPFETPASFKAVFPQDGSKAFSSSTLRDLPPDSFLPPTVDSLFDPASLSPPTSPYFPSPQNIPS